jgi:predicted dehydrogenase
LEKVKIAIVGLGKIARDQHIPSLRSSDAFELIAVASPHHQLDGMPSFGDLPALLHAIPEVEAVARRAIDVDCAPLQLVADAFLCGRRIEVEPFIE